MNKRTTQIPPSLNLSMSPEFIFPGAHPVADRVPALIPIEILAQLNMNVLCDVPTLREERC